MRIVTLPGPIGNVTRLPTRISGLFAASAVLMTIASLSGLNMIGREAFLHATANLTAQDPAVQQYVREVNRTLVGLVDVLLGNEEDFTAALGFEVEGPDADPARSALDPAAFGRMIERVVTEYPGLAIVATTVYVRGDPRLAQAEPVEST